MSQVIIRRCAVLPYKVRPRKPAEAKYRVDGEQRCRFCAPTYRDGRDTAVCGSMWKGSICTRPAGHRGEHVACGNNHCDLKRWRNVL